jgi:hypothetical protein
MFHMFCEKYEKSVEKMRFEHVLRKKCEKCEKCEKTFENPVGKVEL